MDSKILEKYFKDFYFLEIFKLEIFKLFLSIGKNFVREIISFATSPKLLLNVKCMEFFKKIDLPFQLILLGVSVCLPIIHPMYSIFWIFTLPILGGWQMLSFWVYLRNNQLSALHKTYIKIVLSLGTAFILALLLFKNSFEAYLFWGGILAAFFLAVFYLFVTFKAKKVTNH